MPPPIADGILRRVPMLVEYDGSVYPRALARRGGRWPPAHDRPRVRVANVNSAALLIDGRRPHACRSTARATCCCAIAAQANVSVLLRRRRARRPAGPETFADKIVFVGTTALGTREVVATPLDTLFAGVEVQATAADNLLQEDFIRRPEHGVALETQLVTRSRRARGAVFPALRLCWGVLVDARSAVRSCGARRTGCCRRNGTFISPLYPDAGLLVGARRDDPRDFTSSADARTSRPRERTRAA